jgi:hypothetical protein
MNNDYRTRPPAPGPACEYFAPLLPLVGQKRLDPRDSSHLRQHLATCNYCQSELDSYNWLDGALARHFGPAPRGPLSPGDIRELTSSAYRPHTAPPEPVPMPEPQGEQRPRHSDQSQRPGPPSRPARPQPSQRGRRLIPILSALAAVLVIAAVSLALFASHPGLPGNTGPAPESTYIPQQQDRLESVFMLSASNGWAVGATSISDGISQNLILHYAHGQWKEVSGPTNKDLHASRSELTHIFMVSASEGWAIGNLTMATPNDPKAPFGYILHYTGGHWALQKTLANSRLAGISLTSASDGWIVGDTLAFSAQSEHSLLLHYDGHSWTEAQAPGQQLTSITMTSASNGWAVGLATDANGNPGSIVLHYNGSRWAQASIPVIDTVVALAMVSANDGWAIGQKIPSQWID